MLSIHFYGCSQIVHSVYSHTLQVICGLNQLPFTHHIFTTLNPCSALLLKSKLSVLLPQNKPVVFFPETSKNGADGVDAPIDTWRVKCPMQCFGDIDSRTGLLCESVVCCVKLNYLPVRWLTSPVIHVEGVLFCSLKLYLKILLHAHLEERAYKWGFFIYIEREQY